MTTTAGPEQTPAAPAPSFDDVPTIAFIGRYALKGMLGQGGLGQVHEAWDPLLSRTVAVKTLQFNIDAASRVALDSLFLNEARASASLSHPNIVTVHDAGLSGRGVYIAMERLYGRDMRQALAEGWRPTPSQAAQLVRRVADALAYAHARGVVHCDIKPGNIFLVGRDKPKVLDFGIARVTHGHAVPVLESEVVGSPHYLSPEQLMGGTIDARTDIHALGAVFYELLTGRKAFMGDSIEQITTAVLNNHPAPAHDVRSGVPKALSAIAAKAMARNPDDRYASAAEMSAELRRWFERYGGEDTALAAPAAAWSAIKTPGPQRARVLMVSGAIALILVTMALALRHRSAPKPAPAIAQAPATAAAASVVAASAVAPVPVPVPAVAASALPPPVEAEVPATRASNTAPAAAAKGQARAKAAEAAQAKPVAKPQGTAAPAAVRATGALQLAITPWGQVEIDGVKAGTTPPLTYLNLPEGTHTITVRNEDFPPYSATVQISADRPLVIRHRFGQ